MNESYFTYYQSPVGWLEIKISERYLLGISFVYECKESSRHLPITARMCIDQITEYFDGKRKDFEVPIFPSGSTFQIRVWDELMKIPFGETISYLELAKRIGDEKSIRAAGHASGLNPIAIIIPCHRVIGSDGSLTGYSGGLKNKQLLLDHEAKVAGKYTKLF